MGGEAGARVAPACTLRALTHPSPVIGPRHRSFVLVGLVCLPPRSCPPAHAQATQRPSATKPTARRPCTRADEAEDYLSLLIRPALGPGLTDTALLMLEARTGLPAAAFAKHDYIGDDMQGPSCDEYGLLILYKESATAAALIGPERGRTHRLAREGGALEWAGPATPEAKVHTVYLYAEQGDYGQRLGHGPPSSRRSSSASQTSS